MPTSVVTFTYAGATAERPVVGAATVLGSLAVSALTV
jgi:hypothetical protein